MEVGVNKTESKSRIQYIEMDFNGSRLIQSILLLAQVHSAKERDKLSVIVLIFFLSLEGTSLLRTCFEQESLHFSDR